MNVLIRFLKVVSIAVLFIINENHDYLLKTLRIPTRFSGGVIGFLLFYLVVELGRDILVFFYKRRKKMPRGKTDNVVVGIYNLYYLVMGGGLIYFILYLFKLKPSDFITGLSLISAAIAVVMKDYLSSIFSGMILAFSDKLQIGDYVQIGRQTGEIIDFSLTMITLRNDDDEIVYLPTNLIFNHDLINYSTAQEDTVTIPFELNNKMKLAFPVLNEIIQANLEPFRILMVNEELGELFVSQSNQESTTFKYKYTLKAKSIKTNKEIRKALLRAIYDHAKINVPS